MFFDQVMLQTSSALDGQKTNQPLTMKRKKVLQMESSQSQRPKESESYSNFTIDALLSSHKKLQRCSTMYVKKNQTETPEVPFTFEDLADKLDPAATSVPKLWTKKIDRQAQVILFFQLDITGIPKISKSVRVREEPVTFRSTEKQLIASVYLGLEAHVSSMQQSIKFRNPIHRWEDLLNLLDRVGVFSKMDENEKLEEAASSASEPDIVLAVVPLSPKTVEPNSSDARDLPKDPQTSLLGRITDMPAYRASVIASRTGRPDDPWAEVFQEPTTNTLIFPIKELENNQKNDDIIESRDTKMKKNVQRIGQKKGTSKRASLVRVIYKRVPVATTERRSLASGEKPSVASADSKSSDPLSSIPLELPGIFSFSGLDRFVAGSMKAIVERLLVFAQNKPMGSCRRTFFHEDVNPGVKQLMYGLECKLQEKTEDRKSTHLHDYNELMRRISAVIGCSDHTFKKKLKKNFDEWKK